MEGVWSGGDDVGIDDPGMRASPVPVFDSDWSTAGNCTSLPCPSSTFPFCCPTSSTFSIAFIVDSLATFSPFFSSTTPYRFLKPIHARAVSKATTQIANAENAWPEVSIPIHLLPNTFPTSPFERHPPVSGIIDVFPPGVPVLVGRLCGP